MSGGNPPAAFFPAFISSLTVPLSGFGFSTSVSSDFNAKGLPPFLLSPFVLLLFTMLPQGDMDGEGAVIFFAFSQNGLRAGLELREVPAAAKVIPAAVGGAFFCAVTKGLTRAGVLTMLSASGGFGRPVPNNSVAFMGVWL